MRRSASGAWLAALLHGSTHGLRGCAEATSPSASTASIRSDASSPKARAPLAPSDPPEVETSTSVLVRSRPAVTRASSSSAAVALSSALAPVCAASRWAITTSRRLDVPIRWATIVGVSTRPSGPSVLSGIRRVVKPRSRIRLSTRSASPRSPAPPGRRSGNERASSSSELRGVRTVSVPYAWMPSNASGSSVVVSAAGRSVSEKAAMTSANSAGRNAAR